MKKFAVALAAALFLTSCSNEGESLAPESPSVPLFCAETEILQAFPERVSNPQFIETDWEPAEGTDLFAAYNSGGIACSYGIQEAEIGATILWAPDYGIVFNERSKNWIADGQSEIDLPGVDEEKAYILTEGVKGEGEYHLWQLNILEEGFWIQINATFLSSIEESIPLVKAAINSLLTPELAKAQSVKGCYIANLENELYLLDITYHENTTVSANVAFLTFNGNDSKGVLIGNFQNNKLHGIYTSPSGDSQSEKELYFKKVGKNFLLGQGATEKVSKNFERFARPLNLTWDSKVRYIPGEECSTLFSGIQ
jgi:hypothetical protein